MDSDIGLRPNLFAVIVLARESTLANLFAHWMNKEATEFGSVKMKIGARALTPVEKLVRFGRRSHSLYIYGIQPADSVDLETRKQKLSRASITCKFKNKAHLTQNTT